MGKFLYGRGLPLQICITVACEMAFMLMGYDQGVLSSVLSNTDFLSKIDHPNDVKLGVIVGSYNLGSFAGAILTFIFAEKLGRRWCMWVAMMWIVTGAALQASASTRAHFVVGRIICGVGTGIDTSTAPMYQAELSHAKSRGRLVSSECLFVGVGIVIAYWFNYGMQTVGGPVAWRLVIAFQVVFALLTVIMVFGIPESPRYLCKMGRKDEALEVLSAVWNKPTDHPDIVAEQKEILDALALEMEHGEYKWAQILRPDPVKTGYRVLLAWGINTMNQLSGINLVVYFIPTVLQQNVGMTPRVSQLLGGVVNTMFVIGALFPSFFSDKYGRRQPMMWGCFGLGLCMMMISVLLSIHSKTASDATVAFFFLYMLIFGGTVNCIPWVYGPEVIPLHARARGNGLAISAIWIWNFTVVMITPTIINRLQWKAYLIFMCLNFAFVPIIYFFYPETTNLTLEEIDWLFTQGHPPRKAAQELKAYKLNHGSSLRLDSNTGVEVMEVGIEKME
ncbi:Sugar transporter STL1 [Hyphodiscus hymeniophilus]|uniref:Sugar transporter STL1 n=1 Tax=Hyphodiscus hymeniophilus TaxID=353542 RepID=A0A9P6SQG4_9HELO|nr:Sugar transporter STL1 [Hyphodiscus hymeniophilus]